MHSQLGIRSYIYIIDSKIQVVVDNSIKAIIILCTSIYVHSYIVSNSLNFRAIRYVSLTVCLQVSDIHKAVYVDTYVFLARLLLSTRNVKDLY